ncbi:MAG: hypothetical protein HYZ53_28215 [Planctomycetes bacterium]|nr:hypothetical protein [Planctomycetota bacterium]
MSAKMPAEWAVETERRPAGPAPSNAAGPTAEAAPFRARIDALLARSDAHCRAMVDEVRRRRRESETRRHDFEVVADAFLREHLRPLFAYVAERLPNARMLSDRILLGVAVGFDATPEFPKAARVAVHLDLDEATERMRVFFRSEMLPILEGDPAIPGTRSADWPLARSPAAEARVWVEDLLARFVEGYLKTRRAELREAELYGEDPSPGQAATVPA